MTPWRSGRSRGWPRRHRAACGLAAGEGQPGLAGQYGAIFFDEGEGAALGSIVAAPSSTCSRPSTSTASAFKDVVKLRTPDASAESRGVVHAQDHGLHALQQGVMQFPRDPLAFAVPGIHLQFQHSGARRMRSWMTSQISDAASASINARNHQSGNTRAPA
jgi:hypothetical protein